MAAGWQKVTTFWFKVWRRALENEKPNKHKQMARSLEDLASQNGYDRIIETYELEAQNKNLKEFM